MAKVKTSIKLRNVIVGVYEYQLEQLEKVRYEQGVSRSEIIRSAIDLWLRAYALQNKEDESNGRED